MCEKILSNGLTHAQSVKTLTDGYTQDGVEWDFPGCEKFLNIPYGAESRRQCIDIYKPAGEGPFPVIVEVHGGGWFTGDRADNGLGDVAWYFPHDYAIVSIGYRLTDEAVWPGQWDDIQAAVELLLKIGPEHGLDTSRMCATGGSAGTTLSLLMALRTKKFKCAIMLASILDFKNMRKQFEEVGIERTKKFGYPDQDWSIEGLLMGGSVDEVPEICEDLTPINFVDKDCPYIRMYHGKLDNATPYLQTVDFAEKAANITGDPERVQYVLLPGTKHSGGDYMAEWTVNERLEFLKKYL